MNTESLKRLWTAVRHPADSAFRLLHLMESDPLFSKVPDMRDLVLGLPDRYAARYREELEYVEASSLADLTRHPFPYERVLAPREIKVEVSAENGLPFVVHHGKRLFMPKNWTVRQTEDMYRNLLETEGLTGEGCLRKHPHCYVSSFCPIEEGDVVLDVGCAEALLALDVIEKAREVYLFECDNKWNQPLRATFESYKSKVHLVNKFVGGQTVGKFIRLVDAVKTDSGTPFFIKMDIEGTEREVLESSREFLMSNKIKLACCVYHRQDDERYICRFLSDCGFRYEFSEGYMLNNVNGIYFPYFRHGVVFARNYC